MHIYHTYKYSLMHSAVKSCAHTYFRPAERCPGWALQEEIFGPVLPVFKYRDISEVISFIQQGEKPLVSSITVCVLFVCMYDYYVSGSLVRVQLYSRFDNVILAGDCM